MDIGKIDNLHQAKLPSSNKINKENGFKQIFDQKLSEVQETSLQADIDNKGDFLGRSEKILNLLDSYSRDLTNPEKTVKDLVPLVESIEKEVTRVEAEAADKIQDDKDLEGLIRELVVTANVAVFKFHRGDYS